MHTKYLSILKKCILYFNNLKHCDILSRLDICDIDTFPARWRYTCCVCWWPRWAKVWWPHFLPTRLDPQVSTSTSIKSWGGPSPANRPDYFLAPLFRSAFRNPVRARRTCISYRGCPHEVVTPRRIASRSRWRRGFRVTEADVQASNLPHEV